MTERKARDGRKNTSTDSNSPSASIERAQPQLLDNSTSPANSIGKSAQDMDTDIAKAKDGQNDSKASKDDKDAKDASLKLKIRLPKPNSSTGITRTDSNGGSDTDGTGGADKPLKIVIKRSELASSTGTLPVGPGSPSGNRALTIAPCPKIDPLSYPSFQRAVNTSPDQLENWNEKELSSLREDLDGIRKAIKDFSNSLQGQLEVLENWNKDKTHPITLTTSGKPLTSTPSSGNIKKEITQYFPKATGTPSSEPKQKKQKRKKEYESSDDDYDLEGSKLPESDEDELIDIDDGAIPSDVMDADSKAKAQPKRNNKLASLIKNRNQRGKPKILKNRPGRMQKKDRNDTPDDPIYDQLDDDEVIPTTKAKGKHSFWADLEPFFAPFTEEDIKYCSQQPIDGEDPAFTIPALGKYYKEVWGEEEKEEEEARIRAAMAETDESEKSASLGDVTQRILAALIEEKIVTTSALASASSSFIGKPLSRNESVEDMSKNGTNQPELALPLTTPPTYDFSLEGLASLEERIKLELRSIGLLDDEEISFDVSQREDDEICSEIRKLQQQLRDQINSSNAVRSKLHSLIPTVMQQEEADRKERAAIEVFEQGYGKGKKKRKKAVT